MLLHDALLAWVHFIFAFLMVGTLVAELFILRLPVDAKTAPLLSRIDLFYGVSAGLLIVAGVSRVFLGIKGVDYYQHEPFFWAKMATFAIVGLISIPPTITYMRWRKAAAADATFVVPEKDAKRVRLYVTIETHLIVLILLFATLMARGIGGP